MWLNCVSSRKIENHFKIIFIADVEILGEFCLHYLSSGPDFFLTMDFSRKYYLRILLTVFAHCNRAVANLGFAQVRQPMLQLIIVRNAVFDVARVITAIAIHGADDRITQIDSWSRSEAMHLGPKALRSRVNLQAEASIESAARCLSGVNLTIVATGLLHNPDLKPEKSLRSLQASTLIRAYEINTIARP